MVFRDSHIARDGAIRRAGLDRRSPAHFGGPNMDTPTTLDEDILYIRDEPARRARSGVSCALSAGSALRSPLCSSRGWRSRRSIARSRIPPDDVCRPASSAWFGTAAIQRGPRTIPGTGAGRARWHEAVELAGGDPATAWIPVTLRAISSR